MYAHTLFGVLVCIYNIIPGSIVRLQTSINGRPRLLTHHLGVAHVSTDVVQNSLCTRQFMCSPKHNIPRPLPLAQTTPDMPIALRDPPIILTPCVVIMDNMGSSNNSLLGSNP